MRFLYVLYVAFLIAAVSLAGCATVPPAQRMRITNAGTKPITNLVVLFPDQEIPFGNIPPNTTSEYKVFPKGVYAYAAYRYDVNGESVTQPVIDWVGEQPMQGNAFTYTVTYNPNGPQMQRVQLVNVARDQ